MGSTPYGNWIDEAYEGLGLPELPDSKAKRRGVQVAQALAQEHGTPHLGNKADPSDPYMS